MESEIGCFILNQSEFSAFSAIISDNKTSTALSLSLVYHLVQVTPSNYLLAEFISLEHSLYVQDSSGFHFHVCSCCCCYYYLVVSSFCGCVFSVHGSLHSLMMAEKAENSD